MTHMRSLTKGQTPAYARSLLEWRQLGEVLLVYVDVVIGSLAAFEAILAIVKGDEAPEEG